MKRILSHVKGLFTFFDMDHTSGGSRPKVVLQHHQDVEPVLEHNKRLQSDPDFTGWNSARDRKWVASIPLVLIYKWRSEEGIDFFNPDHWPAIARKLNDPEYAHLRTGSGKLPMQCQMREGGTQGIAKGLPY